MALRDISSQGVLSLAAGVAMRREVLSWRTRAGFTLVELLVVIAIIGVLVALPVAGGANGAGIGRGEHNAPIT